MKRFLMILTFVLVSLIGISHINATKIECPYKGNDNGADVTFTITFTNGKAEMKNFKSDWEGYQGVNQDGMNIKKTIIKSSFIYNLKDFQNSKKQTQCPKIVVKKQRSTNTRAKTQTYDYRVATGSRSKSINGYTIMNVNAFKPSTSSNSNNNSSSDKNSNSDKNSSNSTDKNTTTSNTTNTNNNTTTNVSNNNTSSSDSDEKPICRYPKSSNGKYSLYVYKNDKGITFEANSEGANYLIDTKDLDKSAFENGCPQVYINCMRENSLGTAQKCFPTTDRSKLVSGANSGKMTNVPEGEESSGPSSPFSTIEGKSGCDVLVSSETMKTIKMVFLGIQIAGPILVILLVILDLFGAIVSSDDDAFRKVWSHIKVRVIAVAALILLPALLRLLLQLINRSDTFCGMF